MGHALLSQGRLSRDELSVSTSRCHLTGHLASNLWILGDTKTLSPEQHTAPFMGGRFSSCQMLMLLCTKASPALWDICTELFLVSDPRMSHGRQATFQNDHPTPLLGDHALLDVRFQ